MNLLLVVAIATTAPLDTATFAGGCFWSMERAFDQVDGVVSVTVGYTGGHTPRPSYEQVSTGQTGHLESVQVVYDPRKIGYERLYQITGVQELSINTLPQLGTAIATGEDTLGRADRLLMMPDYVHFLLSGEARNGR